MKTNSLRSVVMWSLPVLGLALILLGSRSAATQKKVKESVLYSFQSNGQDAYNPQAGLIFDSAGNLYGTTSAGGSGGDGAVFELSPQSGGWSETVLYSFQGGTDGNFPVAGLIFDAAGDLYGTTSYGGSGGCSYGCGTVFELSPQSGGGWSESVLYSFQSSGADGNDPQASLVFDAAGNLYGTTYQGGNATCSGGCGTVFEVSPQSGGGWSEQVLYTFQDNGKDGYQPNAPLVFDAAGKNLYGTTVVGGTGGCSGALGNGCGTVFELSPQNGGGWSEHVIGSFPDQDNGKDGNYPQAGLVFDAAGNLYGATAYGGRKGCSNGIFGCGIVFEISPKAGGGWSGKTLFSFDGTDGYAPFAGLILDATGNLYATTAYGGSHGDGTAFALLRNSAWAERVFSFTGANGDSPQAGLIFDTAGNLYGTTYQGGSGGGCGTKGCGTVFEITP